MDVSNRGEVPSTYLEAIPVFMNVAFLKNRCEVCTV